MIVALSIILCSIFVGLAFVLFVPYENKCQHDGYFRINSHGTKICNHCKEPINPVQTRQRKSDD